MRVTVTDGNSHFINMEVDADQQIEDVKALLEAEVRLLPFRPASLSRSSPYTLKGNLLMTLIRWQSGKFTREQSCISLWCRLSRSLNPSLN